MNKLMHKFLTDRSGAIALTFTLSAAPVIGMAGAALDYSRAATARVQLQNAVDRAALHAVTAPSPPGGDRAAIARAVMAEIAGDTEAIQSGNEVDVTATLFVPTAFLGIVGIETIAVSSRARARPIFDGLPICILALSDDASKAVHFSGTADFSAQRCVVHSNSSDPNGLAVDGAATVDAAGLCSVGGASVPDGMSVATNCYPADDPYADITLPTASGCDLASKSDVVMEAGSYCDGLTLNGTVHLEPGVYLIAGELRIGSKARVTGDGVAFVLTGPKAGFHINGSAEVTLSAPLDGELKGILVAQERTANVGGKNTLNGGAAVNLAGAIYTPTQELVINGGSRSELSEEAPFMPIIADTVRFNGGAQVSADAGISAGYDVPRMQSGAVLVE